MISSQAQPKLLDAIQTQLILDGTAEAFCKLVRPHQHVLYLKALSIAHSEADVEEVVQNAVFRAFKKLCQSDTAHSSARG
jgi:DNA-directed RNA polymerase specialized sigma24 family protein